MVFLERKLAILKITDDIVYNGEKIVRIRLEHNLSLPDNKGLYLRVNRGITFSNDEIVSRIKQYMTGGDDYMFIKPDISFDSLFSLTDEGSHYELTDTMSEIGLPTTLIALMCQKFEILDNPLEQLMLISQGIVSVGVNKRCIEKGVIVLTSYTMPYYATYHKEWLETLPAEKLLAGV